MTRFANDRRYMGMHNLADKSNQSYFGLEFAYQTIPNELIPFDYDAFDAYPGQVEAVVTNLNTGKAEYLPVPRRDEHFLLLQATCAMPLLFPVYHLDGMPCLDGGAADAIPYERAFEMGCDRVVVVLTRERSYRRKPELLPAINGQISQKTEDLVGPYELHDYFLYYLLRFGFEPGKIYHMALKSFEGVYDVKTVHTWLRTFYRRFFAQQFKRSCLPDGPKVGSVALSPRGDLRMPSDASRNVWMNDLEKLQGKHAED